jgi:hypothetical protein
VKRFCHFGIYTLPSPIIVTKKCEVNGTTRTSNIELCHAGILKKDINFKFYSEAFILLPESDIFANVSLTSSQVLPPHLPELLSQEERRQISYVELRDLLEIMPSHAAMMSQATWFYTLSALSSSHL